MNRLKKLIRLSFPIGLALILTWAFMTYADYAAKNGKQNLIDDIYGKTYNKVFLVEDVLDSRKHGTGFLVAGKSGTKYIITNAHVCKNKSRISIRNDFFHFYSSQVFQDPLADICILNTPQDLVLAPLVLTKKEVLINDYIYSLGFPASLRLVFSEGILSHADFDTMEEPFTEQNYCTSIVFRGPNKFCGVQRSFWVSTMHIIPGQSGSPVFNQDGEVLAMAFVSIHGLYSGFIFLEEIQKVLNKY